MAAHSPPNITHQPHPSGTSDGNYPSLSDSLLKELRDSVQGEVFARIDDEFQPRTTIFNGNVVTPAKAVVIPANVLDVSIVLKFCTKHGLYPSIKAGGYGTAGWAINGDIVVDLSQLNDIHIEEPLPGTDSGSDTAGGFRSLRDTPIQNMKGKAKLADEETGQSEGSLASPFPDAQSIVSNATSAKRRRSADGLFDSGRGLGDLPRDPLVARFLLLGNDIPSPSIRRRLELDSEPNTSTSRVPTSSPPASDGSFAGPENLSRQSSSESGKSGRAFSNDGSSSLSPSTALTSTTPSTVPTSPDVQGDEADEDKKHEGATAANALDVIASISAGLYDQRGIASHMQHAAQLDPLETPTSTCLAPTSITSPPLPPPVSRTQSFSIRSEDPFGYMSAAPGVSSSSSFTAVRPVRGYEQPTFSSAAGSSSVAGVDSSSTPVPMLVDTGVERNPFLESSPRPSFLSAPRNPVHPHAFVSFGAGVKQKDIDIFTALHPLPATSANGSVSSVPYHIPLAAHPVGSSVMLLGGFGFLSRLHGLSIDALMEVEMVLADGTIVFVSENEHPDLWWALRGAGPAFGVVTRYKAKAYPVPVVFAGNLIYNFHASTAASLIKHFRDCIKSAPRELYANVLLTAGPADKGSLIVVQLCYVGAKEKGKEFLQAIASWDGEPCLLNEVCEKSFLSQQDSVAQILRGKAGRQWFIRSALITSLPDEIIHKTVNEFADTPVGCTWLFELAGGAVGDADDTCLPKSQREAGFTIAAFHQWEIDDDDPLCVTTAEHWIEKTLSPVSIGGPYPAFLGRHESATRIIGSYASNWSRLSLLKRKYDPHALLRHTFWPLDAEGAIIEPCTREPKSPIMHPRELPPSVS